MRIGKFAKFLSELGCNIYVITRENAEYGLDNTTDISNAVVQIHRISVGDNFLRDLAFGDGSRMVGWLIPLMQSTSNMLDANDIDAVIHSVPENMPLIVTNYLRHRYDVPYLVDFRDPIALKNWKQRKGSLRIRAYGLLEHAIERITVQNSSNIILNNETMRRLYTEKYPGAASKMHSINNGFDPDDFEGLQPEPSDGFRIVFPGKFRDDMRWFFEAFSRLVDEGADLQFTHFGRKDRDLVDEVMSVVTEFGIQEYVDFRGYEDKRTVLSTILGSDLGLAVSVVGSKTYAGTKTYDYIGADIPILAVDDGESAMREILNDFPEAYVVERNNSNAVYGMLEDLVTRRPDGLGNSDAAKTYNRRNQAAELKNIIESVTKFDSA